LILNNVSAHSEIYKMRKREREREIVTKQLLMKKEGGGGGWKCVCVE